jgi:hypothetical protein
MSTAPEPGVWTWRATIYGWFPGINGTTKFEDLQGGGEITANTNPNSYLSRLQFAFMGTLEARRGPWSVIGDAIYLNFGNHASRINSISGPGGGVALPVDLGTTTNLEGFVGMLAGGYTVLLQPAVRADVLAGIRYARIKSSLDWELSGPAGVLPPSGSAERTSSLTDGIVGARGTFELGNAWYVPWYADAGAGSSRFTWQAMTGIGYHFGWGDLLLAYRHLAYDFDEGGVASNIKFTGPAIAASFRF